MIMWASPVLGCALLASALLLRRRPLTALAVMLGGSAAAMTLQSPVPAAPCRSWPPAQRASSSAT